MYSIRLKDDKVYVEYTMDWQSTEWNHYDDSFIITDSDILNVFESKWFDEKGTINVYQTNDNKASIFYSMEIKCIDKNAELYYSQTPFKLSDIYGEPDNLFHENSKWRGIKERVSWYIF